MIDRQLPALPWSFVTTRLNRCETFAHVYLAQYPVEAIPSRVLQSFQRGFSNANLSRHPFVEGGRPGYVIGYFFSGPSRVRITVALEGYRTASQLRTFFGGFNSSVFAPYAGRVFGTFATHANTIYAELMANTTFRSFFDRADVSVTFAGHSLGAAVAEILGQKFLNLHPNKIYGVSKFGCPRVGNAAWANGGHFMADRSTFYVVNDPIHLHPYATLANISTRAFDWAPLATNYAQSTPYIVYDIGGGTSADALEDSATAYARSCVSVQQAMSPDNAWYYHKLDAYRLYLFNTIFTGGVMDPESGYRFCFLEFDDDNNWMGNYSIGQTVYDGLRQLLVTPPADFVVPVEPIADERRVAASARTHTQPPPVVLRQMPTGQPPIPTGLWRPRRTRDF